MDAVWTSSFRYSAKSPAELAIATIATIAKNNLRETKSPFSHKNNTITSPFPPPPSFFLGFLPLHTWARESTRRAPVCHVSQSDLPLPRRTPLPGVITPTNFWAFFPQTTGGPDNRVYRVIWFVEGFSRVGNLPESSFRNSVKRVQQRPTNSAHH